MKEIKKLKKEKEKLSTERRALKKQLAVLDKVIYFGTNLRMDDFFKKTNFSA